jgi:hypothetical protein
MVILTMNFQINIKKLKIKKIMNIFFYLEIDGNTNFMWFYYRLIVHQRSSNYNRCKLYKIMMVLDGVSNDNKTTWNLNHHQL